MNLILNNYGFNGKGRAKHEVFYDCINMPDKFHIRLTSRA